MKTTIAVSKDGAVIWKKWCKAKNMGSIELMDELIKQVGMKHQQSFYNSLPDPRNVKTNKPLSNISLSKKYIKNRCV